MIFFEEQLRTRAPTGVHPAEQCALCAQAPGEDALRDISDIAPRLPNISDWTLDGARARRRPLLASRGERRMRDPRIGESPISVAPLSRRRAREIASPPARKSGRLPSFNGRICPFLPLPSPTRLFAWPRGHVRRMQSRILGLSLRRATFRPSRDT